MRIHGKTLEIMGRWNTTVYDAWLRFGDYDKIFQYLRWKKPCYYRPYGTVMQGLDVFYHDGTSERVSWCQLRDIIEKYWYHLKVILQEDNGEDLNCYTDKRRIYNGLNRETLTLGCTKITFQTHQAGCCGFDRIMGRVIQ